MKVKVFVPDDEDRVRGCYTSHIKVLQEIDREFGRRKDYRVLILEDNLEAVVAKKVGMMALFEIMVFIFILFMGFLYAHKKGALKWM